MTDPTAQSVTPEPAAPEIVTELAPAPEAEYAPPRPEQEGVVSELPEGGFLVRLTRDGVRYAATGASEAHARELLDTDPAFCRVPERE